MANIRWRNKDIDELQREIERYNRKVKRLAKEGRGSELFEPSLPFEEVKTNITTRAQYKDYLEHLRNLTKRTSTRQYKPAAEKGISLTEGEKAEMNRLIKVINKDRRQMKREYEERTQSKLKDLPKNDINRIQMQPKPDIDKKLSQLNYEKGLNKLNFKAFTESVKKQSDTEYLNQRYEMYKTNYLETVPKTLGYMYGGDVIQRIEPIPAKDFYFAAITNPELSIDFLYDPLTAFEKAEAILNKLDFLGW